MSHTKVSEHFTVEELIASETASKRGIDNTPLPNHRESLEHLSVSVLEPLRAILSYERGEDTPIYITSGYRSPELNEAIGGVSDSQHAKGQAADIQVEGFDIEEVFQIILDSAIPYDQVIQEFDRWIHISYDDERDTQRGEALRATKEDGETVYTYA